MAGYTFFPSLDETLYLHTELIKRFGGQDGVRDKGLIESALARTKSGYYKNLFEQAAALYQSFALNHAFVDGNKRVAFALTSIFLKLNGKHLKVTSKMAESFLVKNMIQNKAEVPEIAIWLKNIQNNWVLER